MINYIHELTGKTLVVNQSNKKKKLLEKIEQVIIAKLKRKLVDL